MENQVQPDIIQPAVPPVEAVTQPSVSPPNNWSKIFLVSLLALIIIAGLVFAGIQIGKGQTTNLPPIIVQPTVIPTQTIVDPTATPVSPISTIIPTVSSIVVTPTVNPTANWKEYINEKYKITFRHPNLDRECCAIGGPLKGNPEFIVTLAQKTPDLLQGTDKPFNGLGIYVLPNKENASMANILAEQKTSLIENYKAMTDKDPVGLKEVDVVVGNTIGTLLIKYAWWGDILYVPSGNNKFVLAIVKTETSAGSFDALFNQILSTFKFL